MRGQILKVMVPPLPWMPRQSPVVTSLMFIIDRGQGNRPYQENSVGISLAENLGLWESRNVLVGWNLPESKTLMGDV